MPAMSSFLRPVARTSSAMSTQAFREVWTELCVTLSVLSAIEDGYEVYVVTDASGSSSLEAHEMGIQRMTQAGATPVTWIGVLSGLQYDWSGQDTYNGVSRIAQDHGGAFGASVNFVRAMRPAPGDQQAEDEKAAHARRETG